MSSTVTFHVQKNCLDLKSTQSEVQSNLTQKMFDQVFTQPELSAHAVDFLAVDDRWMVRKVSKTFRDAADRKLAPKQHMQPYGDIKKFQATLAKRTLEWKRGDYRYALQYLKENRDYNSLFGHDDLNKAVSVVTVPVGAVVGLTAGVLGGAVYGQLAFPWRAENCIEACTFLVVGAPMGAIIYGRSGIIMGIELANKAANRAGRGLYRGLTLCDYLRQKRAIQAQLRRVEAKITQIEQQLKSI